MADNIKIKLYVVLWLTDKLNAQRDRAGIEQYLAEILSESAPLPFRVLPIEDWRLVLEDDHDSEPKDIDTLVASLELDPGGIADKLLGFVKTRSDVFAGIGADPRIHLTEHWCPSEAPYPIFGKRDAARQLMHVDYLHKHGAKGKNVNVVVVDRGVDKSYVRARCGNFGGGWTRRGLPKPGTTEGGHGMMIVRNILDIAPEATIFDCPLLWELPGHITDIPRSLEDAHRAYERMITDINSLRQKPRWQGPWIFANAWAVYDRKSDYGDVKYSDNPDHPFNKSVAKAVQEKIEIVFCAGNCGQFCPDPACGMNDRGPGQSILGANSHPDVLTVAAVRTDALWLGYSSQGPGLLEPQGSPVPTKPDLSAASQFCEMDDEHATNTGTSAACALTAGVVAALRSKWDCTMVPPEKLKDILKETATRIEEYEHDWQWRSRVGSGILNAERAYQKLASLSDNGP